MRSMVEGWKVRTLAVLARTSGILSSYPSATFHVVPLPICDGEESSGAINRDSPSWDKQGQSLFLRRGASRHRSGARHGAGCYP
jgi:hypothetical protein